MGQDIVFNACYNCIHYDICPTVFEDGEWEICELHHCDPDMDLHNDPAYLDDVEEA